MKVFLTGGTGAIGGYVIPALLAAGHHVTALSRSFEKSTQLSAAGARPVEVSMFDVDQLTDAFDSHDVVANLATAVPSPARFAFARAWRDNARIRSEGSAAVVEAALAAGVPRLVQESISMVYPDSGSEWIDESVPLDVFPIVRTTPIAEANAERFTDAGGTAVVLRFGLFYGPGSEQSAQMLRFARLHFGIRLGAANGYFSSIHLQDAANAVVAALTAPAGIYNVVDDEPVTKAEYADALSNAVGKKAWLAGPGRLSLLGGKNMSSVNRSLRVSNQAFRSATDWTPDYSSVREGWAATAREIRRFA